MDSFDHRKLLNNSANQERERFKVKDLLYSCSLDFFFRVEMRETRFPCSR
jgi:hypothetical protein